jgi:hypothetical protein
VQWYKAVEWNSTKLNPECIGIDMRGREDEVDFELLLDRLDYLTTDKSKEVRPQAGEIASRGLREFMNHECSEVATKVGPYDRLVPHADGLSSLSCIKGSPLTVTLSKGGLAPHRPKNLEVLSFAKY